MNTELELRNPLAVQSIDAYIAQANTVPVLSVGEEQALARAWREEKDIEAARRLVLSHLRFVVYVARGYIGYGLPLADLVQEGNVGLMKAVKRFDPDQGVRLVSYAVHWIRAEIHEFILRNWRIVKVATTKAQRKLFFNIRKAKKRLGWLNSGEVAQVARDLGVREHEVLEMERRLAGQDIGFDGRPDQDDDPHPAPAAYLEDRCNDPANVVADHQKAAHDHSRLHEALRELDERSRDILVRRWLGDAKITLKELAADHGVSLERIRQIEKTALERLRCALET